MLPSLSTFWWFLPFRHFYNVAFWCDFSYFLLTVTSCFQNQFYFWHALLKIYKAFLYNIFRNINNDYFLYDQIPKFLSLSIGKEFIFLLLLLKIFPLFIFFSKDSISAYIMYGSLFDLMYWFNSKVLFFWVSKTVTQKYYFYIIFHMT